MASFLFMGSNLVGVATQSYNSGSWDGHSIGEHLRGGRRQRPAVRGVGAAMAHGQLYLDEEPPQWLQDMADPYDKGARDEAQKETGEPYLFDVAYHDGHYYVYFGVVPVVLFYLPFYLLTGANFPTAIGVLIAVRGIRAGMLGTARPVRALPLQAGEPGAVPAAADTARHLLRHPVPAEVPDVLLAAHHAGAWRSRCGGCTSGCGGARRRRALPGRRNGIWRGRCAWRSWWGAARSSSCCRFWPSRCSGAPTSRSGACSRRAARASSPASWHPTRWWRPASWATTTRASARSPTSGRTTTSR